MFGLGAWGLGTVILKSFRWANQRERQMESVARRAVELARGDDGGLLARPAQEGRTEEQAARLEEDARKGPTE